MGRELERHYADKAMFTAEPTKGDGMPQVTLISATPDPLGALTAMSLMYKGKVVRDLSTLSNEERRHYWEESFKTHLKAPWESIDFHFLVENVTRAFTHQMVRQRTAVYAQESMRFAVKDKIAARPGPLIKASGQQYAEDLNDEPSPEDIWEAAIVDIWHAYRDLIEAGIPAEEARGILPHDTLTRLHYKTNLRNLAEHLGNRLCTQAQFEWRLVAAQLRQAIRDYKPIFGHPEARLHPYRELPDYAWQFEWIAESNIFQPVCFAAGRCPFHAEYDRGCTIRKRVDEGRFNEIEPKEWLADPQAAWVR